jgi:hypothetical protein
MRDTRGREAPLNLIDIAFATGMHGLAGGALAAQFLDVPQKTLNCLVLMERNKNIAK